MLRGQKIQTDFDITLQGRSFKAGQIFEVYIPAEDHEKENHVLVLCTKKGVARSSSASKNFVGLNQKQLDLAIEKRVLEFI